MSETIPVNLEELKKIFVDFRNEGLTEVSTTDVLRKYQGGYFKNTGTLPSQSFNANFGKLLKRNQTELGITELSSAEPTVDDLGGKTNSSIWSIE